MGCLVVEPYVAPPMPLSSAKDGSDYDPGGLHTQKGAKDGPEIDPGGLHFGSGRSVYSSRILKRIVEYVFPDRPIA